MKKLMIAVAAVACAVAANAATFSWSAEGVKDADGNEANGQVGFFFYGSDTGSAVTTWTIDAAIAAVTGAAAPTLGAQYLVLADGGGLGGGEMDDIAAVVAGEKVGGFIVMTDVMVDDLVFDENTGAIIGGWTAPEKYSVISGGEGALVTVDGALDNDYPMGFSAATGASMNDWKSVPEPTSGLLLLIGVAGLALRRRRA